jgi:two-component system sensor histidine kinase/response regulator
VSFRLKTILGIAAIEAILLAILIFSGLRWLHDSNEEQLVQRSATTARLFATTTKNAVLTMDLASLESLVREALANPGVVYARVRGEDGEVLAEGGEKDVLARPFAADTDPSLARDGVFDSWADIAEGGVHFGRVEVGLSVDAFHVLMRRARLGALGLAGLEMLLVALFSLALGTYLTRQLRELRDASHRIAREGPGFHVPVQGKDEVAQAILAFNTMSSRLADAYAEQRRALEASNDLATRFKGSEAQKAAMLDAALDAIISIDLEGRVLEYNASAEQLFGYTRDEAVGRMLDDLIIPDRHRADHRRGMERFRKSGVGRMLGKRLELPALNKVGAELPMEIAITRVATEHGDFLTAFMRDMSERKRAEEELRLAAHAFEAQEAIFVTDSDARILRVNSAFTKITGYTADEAVGQTPRLLRSGRQEADFYKAMWGTLTAVGHWVGEIENRRKSGEIFPEWLSITAVHDSEGQTTNYVAHFIDITEHKKSQAALEEARVTAERASEAKSRFLATMSHEIRTPLNAIINLNDLLLDTDLDSDQRAYAAAAGEGGRNLLSIVNSVLDFSKIEAGRVEGRSEPCDPEAVAESVVRLLAPRAFAKGIEMTLFVDPEVPRMFRTDPGLLRQILLNLVGNAVKFTETGGVRVRLLCESGSTDSAWARFDVIDTGVGIPVDKQSEVFDEFTQGDGSHTRKFGGTGLGLAISRSLARILGGDVECESEPGRGSRFSLRIPMLDTVLTARREGDLPQVINKRTILAKSTNPILADEIAEQLKVLGLCARVTEDLLGAQEWLGDSSCAGVIVLVDDAADVADGHVSILDSARQIVLTRSERTRPMNETAQGYPVRTERVPLTPSALYRALREAVVAVEGSQEPVNSQHTPLSEAKGGPTAMPILLVEDSPPNRLVATAILSKAGYSVDTAENGLQALAAVTERRYGLVLMDIAMAEMDGFEATRAIRALGGEPSRVPIVAMTAGAFDEDKQRCLDAGMNDYLSKPVVRAELLNAVDRWLKRADTDGSRQAQDATSDAHSSVAGASVKERE